MQNNDGVWNKFVENLPHVWLHFVKVVQQIKRDNAPLFRFHGLGGQSTCASELPSEKAKVRFIFTSIM
jgi:hypothetical protein